MHQKSGFAQPPPLWNGHYPLRRYHGFVRLLQPLLVLSHSTKTVAASIKTAIGMSSLLYRRRRHLKQLLGFNGQNTSGVSYVRRPLAKSTSIYQPFVKARTLRSCSRRRRSPRQWTGKLRREPHVRVQARTPNAAPRVPSRAAACHLRRRPRRCARIHPSDARSASRTAAVRPCPGRNARVRSRHLKGSGD